MSLVRVFCWQMLKLGLIMQVFCQKSMLCPFDQAVRMMDMTSENDHRIIINSSLVRDILR